MVNFVLVVAFVFGVGRISARIAAQRNNAYACLGSAGWSKEWVHTPEFPAYLVAGRPNSVAPPRQRNHRGVLRDALSYLCRNRLDGLVSPAA